MSGPGWPASLAPARLQRLVADIAGTGPAVPVRAPFTGEVITELPTSTTADVAAAAGRARIAQRAWAARPVAERCAVLLRLHDLVLEFKSDLLDVVQAETGKARGHAFEEVLDVALVSRYYGRAAAGLLAPRRRAGAIPGLTRTVELRHPLGLVGLITPWNYPLTLGVSDALPALVAGNAVLHKPDSQTVLTTLSGRQLAIRAGLPPDLWPVVVGDGATVGSLVIDTVDQVTFTGSTATGRTVAARAAARLIPVSLELGGKNAMLVCDDAPLDAAVTGAVIGSFASTGQLCISMERIYVHRNISDELTRRFAAASTALRVGADYGDAFQLGSLTSPASWTGWSPTSPTPSPPGPPWWPADTPARTSARTSTSRPC